ncbi:3-hydroxyacyl-CoA dehydrogenase family protein [Halovenus rubra]|uniref:3-hydroxyacyl-CoA dehydrogenase family protein n=2 Tax=Halovenus rubra TaxID=869890 RepID=A0ABD5X8A9_9EURY|nr:3-hydroxyacyl-CoA dehydrogenase family protein [Halovenus rubra]
MDIAVLGADRAAQEIARACLLAGETVRLHATDATAVMDGIDIIERDIDDAYDTGYVDADRRDMAVKRLEGTTGLDAAVTDVDIVIDATTQDVSALQTRFAKLEELLDDAVVSSAVSAISVTNAAAGLRQPKQAVGFRFHRFPEPFVEVVMAEQTGSEAASLAWQLAERVSSDCVSVRDTPGNLSLRLTLALEVAAIRMLDEGVAGVEAIDTAFKHTYRSEVGPLERADSVGLDERYDTLRSLSERLGSRFEPPPMLTALVEEGQTGKEAGEGFYIWEDDTPTRSALADPTIPDEQYRPDSAE